MFNTTTVVVTMLALVGGEMRSQIPIDTVRALGEVNQRFVGLGRRYGESVWPGFRPDTIPVAYVFPHRGTALFNWRGALPAGFESVPGTAGAAWLAAKNLGAANTGTTIDDRAVAQVVVSSFAVQDLVPLAFHEAFHVFEHASQKPDLRFGRGENSFYVASYPIFGVRNEALWAVEGCLLADALAEKSAQKKRDIARQFIAVRRARQSALDASFAEFEQASEMNEGLAEYALVRALQLLANDSASSPAQRAASRKHLADRLVDLRALTSNVRQSIRLRFYQTGPAEAMLIADLAGPGWKKTMMQQNQTLQDALAAATGIDDAQRTAFSAATAKLDTIRAVGDAEARVASLVSLRTRQVDSVLSAPGVLLELSASQMRSKDFNSCGFDPQNLLQVSPAVQMQTRWWKPCVGGFSSEFNITSVHDDRAGTVRAVIGAAEDVKLTIDGAPVLLTRDQAFENAANVKLEAPRVSAQASRARVQVEGRLLKITPLP